MEKVKHIAIQHQEKFKYLLLIGAAIAALNTLARPDFNLILYLYIYYVWNNMSDSKENQGSEKINSFFILLYSLLIDFIWTLFWGSHWFSLKNDYEGAVHTIVIILSWIGILLKIVGIIVIAVVEWGSIKSSLPSKLQEKLNNNNNFVEQKDEIV